MADQPSSPAARELNTTPSEQGTPNPTSNQSDPLPVSSSSTPTSAPAPPPASVAVNLNSNPPLINQQPASIPSYAPPPMSAGAVLPPTAPSFRPAPPQFSPLPNHQNPNFQNHMMQPPGVNPVPGSLMMPYHIPPGQHPNPAMRQYTPMSNGYTTMPMPPPQGAIPPGVRYPSPYPAMVRPAFPLRPPGAIGVFPVLPRPPVPGIQGIRPVIPVRPALVPVVTPAEKPQTTVYVGKIALTVEDDFMLSLLRLCGPVKDWKRARDPKDGTPKGFGFCEFESAEGVLRALRLLSKLNVDRQELVLNVNKATREYLGRYVEKKTENSKKLKETEAEGAEKEDNVGPGPDMNETTKPSVEDTKKDDNNSENKDNQDSANFGIVTDEDREADREASEKLTAMMEERAKNKPLPLPPPPPLPPALAIGDGSGNLTSELPTKSRDGDSDVDIMRSDGVEDKNDEDTTSEKKPPNEHDRADTSSPDRNRKYDRRSRDRDRDLKREKEREFEKLEKETQRERERKERERERKIQEAERAEREYKEFVSSWESREREKEKQRQYEKEREKDRERKRKKEIKDEETDDNDSRKRMRRSLLDEKRRKRIREKEDDLDDRLREEEEIAEANRRAIEEEKQQQQEKDALKLLSGHMTDQSVKAELAEETNAGSEDTVTEHAEEGDSSHEKHTGDVILQNGTGDESTMSTMTSSETRQGGNVPAKKLGFGLVGSGKRTAVPSVFYEEEDEDARNDKKMRPLVPIDYSTEELQAVHPSNNTGAAPPNLAAAAEFAKRISNSGSKEDKPDIEKERSRRSHDKRDRVRNDEDSNHARDENREKIPERDRDREHGLDKLKTPDNRKLLDAKQLIDMIPKTKEELFSYEINWDVYDKHDLHERMQPWISKKITEFLGEEETTLVDYIVSRTREHVKASQMLDQLQTILDDEAEMFVLKLWRMLIFEIKKVETGLAMRSKS